MRTGGGGRGRPVALTLCRRSYELMIVDPQQPTVSWMGLEAGSYQHLKRSRLVEIGPAELAELIDWP